MPPMPSPHAVRALRSLAYPSQHVHRFHRQHTPLTPFLRSPLRASPPRSQRLFSSTPAALITLNQIRKHPRQPKKARRKISPAMSGRPSMKGVCLKVGITKPKKPNSGQRKTAKVKLSTGRVVSAYIPGEGELLLWSDRFGEAGYRLARR